MRTATALWEKLRVPRAAIAILASRSTQLRRPTSVPIVNLHYHVLSAQECVQPVKDVASSHTYALYGPGTGLQCRFVVTSRSLRSSWLQAVGPARWRSWTGVARSDCAETPQS